MRSNAVYNSVALFSKDISSLFSLIMQSKVVPTINHRFYAHFQKLTTDRRADYLHAIDNVDICPAAAAGCAAHSPRRHKQSPQNISSPDLVTARPSDIIKQEL